MIRTVLPCCLILLASATPTKILNVYRTRQESSEPESFLQRALKNIALYSSHMNMQDQKNVSAAFAESGNFLGTQSANPESNSRNSKEDGENSQNENNTMNEEPLENEGSVQDEESLKKSKALKVEDVQGRLESKKLADALHTDTANSILKNELEAREAALDKAENCVKEQVLKLHDVAGRLDAQKLAEDMSSSNLEKAAEDEAARLRLEIARKEKENEKAIPEPQPDNPVLDRVDAVTADIDSREKSIKKDEGEIDCEEDQTLQDVAAIESPGSPVSNPIGHEAALQAQEKASSGGANLVNTIILASQQDLGKTGSLLDEVDELILTSKTLYDEASRQMSLKPVVSDDPCETTNDGEKTAREAADLAQEGLNKLDDAEQKLKDVLVFLEYAKNEADKASLLAEELEKDPCVEEDKLQSAVARLKTFSDKEKEYRSRHTDAMKRLLDLRELLDALKRKAVWQISRTEKKVHHVRKQEVDCPDVPHVSENPCFEDLQTPGEKAYKEASAKEDSEIEGKPAYFSSINAHFV